MSSRPPESALTSILEAGLLAPSADNRHLLEFRRTPDGISIFGSGEFHSAPPHRKILCLISFGAVVENMMVRAASLGFSVTTTWEFRDANSAPLASLQLSASGASVERSWLDAAIPRRHTNRRLRFRGPRLSDPALIELRNLAEGVSGISLSFIDEGVARRTLLRLLARAEAERFNHREMHEELFGSIRFDLGWQQSAPVGLAPATLCVEPGFRWAFEALGHWPVMNVVRKLGAVRLLALRAAYLPCAWAPHLGALTTRDELPVGAARAGQALQRVWLASELAGMAFQPFAGPALLALREYAAVPSSLGDELRRGWARIVDGTPLMVFRLGRARPPSVRSGRLPLSDFIRSSSK